MEKIIIRVPHEAPDLIQIDSSHGWHIVSVKACWITMSGQKLNILLRHGDVLIKHVIPLTTRLHGVRYADDHAFRIALIALVHATGGGAFKPGRSIRRIVDCGLCQNIKGSKFWCKVLEFDDKHGEPCYRIPLGMYSKERPAEEVSDTCYAEFNPKRGYVEASDPLPLQPWHEGFAEQQRLRGIVPPPVDTLGELHTKVDGLTEANRRLVADLLSSALQSDSRHAQIQKSEVENRNLSATVSGLQAAASASQKSTDRFHQRHERIVMGLQRKIGMRDTQLHELHKVLAVALSKHKTIRHALTIPGLGIAPRTAPELEAVLRGITSILSESSDA